MLPKPVQFMAVQAGTADLRNLQAAEMKQRFVLIVVRP